MRGKGEGGVRDRGQLWDAGEVSEARAAGGWSDDGHAARAAPRRASRGSGLPHPSAVHQHAVMSVPGEAGVPVQRCQSQKYIYHN